MVPLISTSELSTLRPLGLDELDRCDEELLGEGDAAGLSELAGGEDEFSEPAFCPITF